MGTSSTPALDRREVVCTLLADRGDLLVVAGLGSAAWDISAAGDSPLNFPLWGGMGGAAMIGLGLAIAQPQRRVLVLTGDGEMLMGIGSLATVAVERPANLSIVVLDNEHYGETGMQRAHTGLGVDLVGVARACGFAEASVVTTPDGVSALRSAIHARPGLRFAQIKIAAAKEPFALPPRDGAELKNRFRSAVLGPHEAHHQR